MLYWGEGGGGGGLTERGRDRQRARTSKSRAPFKTARKGGHLGLGAERKGTGGGVSRHLVYAETTSKPKETKMQLFADVCCS